jgi:hypothetical protein
MWGSSARSMPTPVSDDVDPGAVRRGRDVDRTVPPRGVNLIAFADEVADDLADARRVVADADRDRRQVHA